jgi:uncharacterized protein YceH (UPF0502 family)
MPLSPEEARVLGCLLEKERTTPDAYPLSMNALVSACNQSTNRNPVVSYSEDTVEAALDQLRERSFVRRGVYPGSRVIKYKHVLGEALGVGEPELALIGVLLLRGPQTPGELKARTERLHAFADAAALQDTLDGLFTREEPLAKRLEREPGQKEARVRELLTDPAGDVTAVPDEGTVVWKPDPDEVPAPGASPAASPAARAEDADAALTERLEALEAEVATLRRDLEMLRDSLGG